MAHEQYLTYGEYSDYGGKTVSQSAFSMEEFKARKHLDYLTDSRVQAMETVPEEVKRAVFILIELESKIGATAQVENPIVASFNTDGYSENYGSVSDQVAAAKKSAMSTIKNLLYGVMDDRGVPLLYRGLDL